MILSAIFDVIKYIYKQVKQVGIPKLTIRDVPLESKTVLLRTDYNLPLKPDGGISDDLRVRASLPTIEYLLKKNCKIVIISHLGRPEGDDPKLSLEPVAGRLAKLLKKDVLFVDQTIGDKPRQAIKRAPAGSIIVLENLRFHKEEEADDREFAKKLAENSGADYFVQDGFGVVHRAHASTDAITHYLPSVAGLLLEKEYNALTSAVSNPKMPLVAVIGGAKVSDKIGIIDKFIDIADSIVIAGAMANTFLSYKGLKMGASKLETDQQDVIDKIYKAAQRKAGDDINNFLILPTDVVVAKQISPASTFRTVSVDNLADDDIALDIGEKTMARVCEIVSQAKTVIWNGTLGYAELPQFARGSGELAQTIVETEGLTSIIGGGDTADFVLKWQAHHKGEFTHISTGGGASIELMSGLKLPGIESLLDAPKKLR